MRVGDVDGHGRYGVLDRGADYVVCHECGRRFRMLVQHLRGAHEMTVEEYRRAHGLPRSQALVCEETSETIRQQSLDRVGSATWRRFEARRDETLPESQKIAAASSRDVAPAVLAWRQEEMREMASGIQEDRQRDLWETRLREVINYRRQHGQDPTRAVGASDEPRRLGRWLLNQRSLARRRRLPQWKLAALHEAGFDLNPGRGRRAPR